MSRSSVRWMACLAIVGLIVTATAQAQQRGQGQGQGRGQGGPGGGFGGGFGGSPLTLLTRKDVQDELELLDDQKTQITAMNEKSRERIRTLFQGGGGGGGNREELQATMRKAQEETQAELDKILLPHQAKRLKQIEFQSRMRGRVSIGGDVAVQLGISEDEQGKLRDKADALEQELRKKASEIRKQLQDQLVAQLSPDQQAKFKELVGDPFEFKDEPGQGFGGFGGGGATGGGGQGRTRGGNNNTNRPQRPNNN